MGRGARRPGLAAIAWLAVCASACQREPQLMQDGPALAEAQRALNALPEFAGRAPQIHGAALFHDRDIEVALVDPTQPKAMYIYRYEQGRWQRGERMDHLCPDLKARGLSASDLPLAQLRFETAAVVHANWYQSARGVPGALPNPERDRLVGIWFHTGRPGARNPWPPSWSTMPVPGKDDASYEIEFKLDGSVSRFERLR